MIAPAEYTAQNGDASWIEMAHDLRIVAVAGPRKIGGSGLAGAEIIGQGGELLSWGDGACV